VEGEHGMYFCDRDIIEESKRYRSIGNQ
jgi:hypothetical protein